MWKKWIREVHLRRRGMIDGTPVTNGSTQQSYPWTGWISLLRCYRQFVRIDFFFTAQRETTFVLYLWSHNPDFPAVPFCLQIWNVSQAANLDLDHMSPWDAENECFRNSTVMLILVELGKSMPLVWSCFASQKVLRHFKKSTFCKFLAKISWYPSSSAVCCCGFVCVCVCLFSAASGLLRRAICLDNNASWKVCHKILLWVRSQNSQTFRKFCCSKFFPQTVGDLKQILPSHRWKISSVCPPQETTTSRKPQTQQHKNSAGCGRKRFKHQNYCANWDATFRKHYKTPSLPVASIFWCPNDRNTTPQYLGICKKMSQMQIQHAKFKKQKRTRVLFCQCFLLLSTWLKQKSPNFLGL